MGDILHCLGCIKPSRQPNITTGWALPKTLISQWMLWRLIKWIDYLIYLPAVNQRLGKVHRMRLCLRPNSQCRWLVVGKCCVVNVGDLHKQIFTTPVSIGAVRSVSLVVHEIVHSSKFYWKKIRCNKGKYNQEYPGINPLMQQLEGPDTELRASEISGLFGPKFRPPDIFSTTFHLRKSWNPIGRPRNLQKPT